MRFLDLSHAIECTPSEATPVKIDVLRHDNCAHVFGLEQTDFPDGLGLSNETVSLTTHTGTHIDAPLHYGPLTGDRPARSIDNVPLEWCWGQGVRLDVRFVPAGKEITLSAIMRCLDDIGHCLVEGDIVLLWTGADKFWGHADYLSQFPGLSLEATAFLVESGVRVIGTDAWGLDRPFKQMLSDYRETGDQSVLWPAHFYGRKHEYLQIEKLANLDQLNQATGYTVICFPVAIKNLGAGWSRVVAMFD